MLILYLLLMHHYLKANRLKFYLVIQITLHADRNLVRGIVLYFNPHYIFSSEEEFMFFLYNK